MTINELKEKYYNKIKFFNNKLNGNHLITIDDVNNEVICKKYNVNSLNVFSNYGLIYENDEPIFLFNKIDSIEIVSDKLNVDCKGGNVKVECFAIINVFNGDKVYNVIRHKINPLYSFEGCSFNFINNIVIIGENFDFVDKSITINAKYGYNGILYKYSLKIIQTSNYESDWIEGDEEIADIIAECSKNEIPNSGGEIEVNINKKSILNLYKKDSFGRITSTKKAHEIITDITDKTIISVNSPFKINGYNKIIFPPQNINSPIRTANIIYKYKNFEKEINIFQEKGPVISYENEFNFYDGSDTKLIKLDNCLNNKFEVKLLSNKIRFLDGVEYDKISDNDILIDKDSDWFDCKMNNENMSLEIIASKNNTNNIRRGNITLNNKNKYLYLHIIQPQKLEVKCEYYISLDCDSELFVNELTEYTIKFKPIKKIYYDDNTVENIEYLEPFYKLDVIFNNSNYNDIVITKPKMIDFNGVHESKIYIKNYNNYKDINLEIKYRIIDVNLKQISDVFNKNITIHFLKPNVKDIEVNINVTNKKNYQDISSKNQPIFRIIDSKDNIIYETNISRFWVNQYMKNDLVYNCTVNLIENETYTFYIDKYFYLDNETKELSEKYVIENDDIGIDLNIDI